MSVMESIVTLKPVPAWTGRDNARRFLVDCVGMSGTRSAGKACSGRDLKDVERIVTGDCLGRDTRRNGLPIEDFESWPCPARPGLRFW